MDRNKYYFGQPVSQVEFNGTFDSVENAVWGTLKDRRLFGIVTGFVPAPSPMSGMTATPWNIAFSAGVAYDKNGARLFSNGVIATSVLTDTLGVSTVPSASSRRWVSIYARFGRNNTDARTDKDGNSVLFSSVEALNPDDVQAHVGELLVVSGSQDLTSNPLPARPATQTAVLLADVLLTDGDSSLVMAAIDTSRAERMSRTFGWALPDPAEFTTTGGAKYVLMQSSPSAVGVTRVYASTAGMVFTTNAVWNQVLQVFAADNPSNPASYLLFATNGILLSVRQNTSAPWADVNGTSGWDSQLNLLCSSANGNLQIDANTDIVTQGTQHALFGLADEIQTGASYLTRGTTVPFSKTFSAAPSSITLATISGLADAPGANPGAISSVLPITPYHANGVLIDVTLTDVNSFKVYRNVTATY